jgi:hypothetical protein
MSRWFRHYAGMMRDEKLVSAAVKAKQPVERVIWVWGAILESAAEEQNDGRFTLDPDEAAYFLRCSGDDVSAILVALEALGRLHQGAVVRWNDRQYISDSSADRVRKHRKKRTETDVQQRSDVTADSCNTEVTPEDRYGNENETSPSVYVSVSDSKTSAEKITDEFEIWYSAYPRHKARGDAIKAYRKARKLVDAGVLLTGAKAASKKYAGADQQFTPYPASWLNGEQWKDEDLQPPKPQEPTSNGGVYVTYGTEPGDAWERDYRGRGKIPPRDARGGWYHPSEYPEQNVKRETTEAA